MLKLEALSRATGCTVLAKAEFLNPMGSSKDRIARQMILDAEERGELGPGGTVVEGTSGSTGISLAAIARARGYKFVCFMPDDVAAEKEAALRVYGADVRRVKNVSIVNSQHYVRLAKAHAEATEGGFFTDQFENLSNFKAHVTTTGPEILRQVASGLVRDGDAGGGGGGDGDGDGATIDAFVMGSGTGGTIAGVSTVLKEAHPDTQVVLVDPPGSSLYNAARYGVCYAPEQAERRLRRHRYDTIIEGVGLDRLTANFKLAKIDHAEHCSDQEAVDMSRWLLAREGLFCGSSSAMNCVGVVKTARRLGPGHTIVTILCDSGTRHMTRFHDDAVLARMGLSPTPGAADDEALDFVRRDDDDERAADGTAGGSSSGSGTAGSGPPAAAAGAAVTAGAGTSEGGRATE